jgi:hypothetical protein
MQMRSLGESEKALESARLPVSYLQTPPLSRNDYFGDWQTPPSYPYGLLQRDVIIAALGARVSWRCPGDGINRSGAPPRSEVFSRRWPRRAGRAPGQPSAPQDLRRQEVAMPDAIFDRDQLAADLDDVLRGAGHPLANAVSGFAKKLFVGFDDCCGGHVRNAIDCSSHEQLATNYFARFASCAASFDLSRSRGCWISNTFRNLNSTWNCFATCRTPRLTTTIRSPACRRS